MARLEIKVHKSQSHLPRDNRSLCGKRKRSNDLMRDATPTVIEEAHIASLKNLAFRFAYIVNSKSMLEKVKSRLKKLH